VDLNADASANCCSGGGGGMGVGVGVGGNTLNRPLLGLSDGMSFDGAHSSHSLASGAVDSKHSALLLQTQGSAHSLMPAAERSAHSSRSGAQSSSNDNHSDGLCCLWLNRFLPVFNKQQHNREKVCARKCL
jgi:hypothetical protein